MGKLIRDWRTARLAGMLIAALLAAHEGRAAVLGNPVPLIREDERRRG